MRSIFALSVLLVTCGLTVAAENIDGKKLIGIWKLSKVDGDDFGNDNRVKFLKDGQFQLSSDGKLYKAKGKYTLKDDQFTMTFKEHGMIVPPNSVWKGSIQKLTDDELVFERDKQKYVYRKLVKDLDLIQGEWMVVDSSIKQQIGKKLTVMGDEWTAPLGQKFTIKIDESKKPKELTLVRNNNDTFDGIYKLEDDKLTFCRTNTSGGARPQEFKATPTNDLLILKRPSGPSK